MTAHSAATSEASSLEDVARRIVSRKSAASISVVVLSQRRPSLRLHVVSESSVPNERYYWTCAGKTLVVLALATLVQDGRLSFDDPLPMHLPALTGAPWDSSTIADLLSYDVPIDGDPAAVSVYLPEGAVVEHIGRVGWSPRSMGRGSTYNIWTNAFLLGEVIRHCSDMAPADFIRARVLDPLGLDGTILQAPPELLDEHLAPFACEFESERCRADVGADAVVHADRYWPGVSVTGPMCDLAVAMSALLWTDASDPGGGLISADVARQVRTPRNTPRSDGTHVGSDLSWGLGVIVDRRMGGRRGSARSFGQVGDNGSVIVCADPDKGLVVALGLRGSAAGARTAFVRATILEALLREFSDELEAP